MGFNRTNEQLEFMDSQNQHNLGMLAEDYTDKILNSTASLIDLESSNQIELINVLTGNQDSGGKNVLKGNFLEGFFFGDTTDNF